MLTSSSLLRLAPSLLLLTACVGEPGPMPAKLREEFQPGMALAEAQQRLLAHGATLSVMNADECAIRIRQSATIAQLSPRGGPCIFGKIPVSHNRFGGSTDVILQLVFGSDESLADGSFEELASGF